MKKNKNAWFVVAGFFLIASIAQLFTKNVLLATSMFTLACVMFVLGIKEKKNT